jgi:hypothetical protein
MGTRIADDATSAMSTTRRSAASLAVEVGTGVVIGSGSWLWVFPFILA